MTTPETIAQLIYDRFKRSYPPIGLALQMDEGEDAALMENVLGHISWYELDIARLRQSELAPSGLSREAFEYYLPAFLLASLDFEGSGTLGMSTYLCVRPEVWHDRVCRAKWLSKRISNDQREIIYLFIEHLYRTWPAYFKNDYKEEVLDFWRDPSSSP